LVAVVAVVAVGYASAPPKMHWHRMSAPCTTTTDGRLGTGFSGGAM